MDWYAASVLLLCASAGALRQGGPSAVGAAHLGSVEWKGVDEDYKASYAPVVSLKASRAVNDEGASPVNGSCEGGLRTGCEGEHEP